MKVDPKKLANEFIDSHGRTMDRIEELNEQTINLRKQIQAINCEGLPSGLKEPVQELIKECLELAETSLAINKVSIFSMRQMRTFFDELLKELK